MKKFRKGNIVKLFDESLVIIILADCAKSYIIKKLTKDFDF